MNRDQAPPESVVRVLMVDDDNEDYFIVKRLLNKIPGPDTYTCFHTTSFENALAQMQANSHDIYIVDLRLGIHNGLELIRAARPECTAPIVLLTGSGNLEVDRESMRRGANDYLSKTGLDSATLERTLRYALEQSRGLARIKASEARLRRSESELRDIIENHPDAVALMRSGVFVYVNPALVRALGYTSSADMVADPIEVHVHHEDKGRVLALLNIHESSNHEITPVRFTRNGGGEVLMEWLPTRNVTFKGKPATMIALRDVTAQRKQQASAALSQKMNSLGTLAAGVAHELNNPLTFITSNLSMVTQTLAQMETGDAQPALDDLKDMISEALVGAERMRTIVRAMSSFADGQPRDKEHIHLPRLLDQISGMAGDQIRHKARLVRDYRSTLPMISGNEAQLGQMFLNLLVNAVEAIEEGNPEGNEIRIRASIEAGWAVVEISDTGSGIPKEVLERIFDPFFTTRPVGGGFGLGLAIAHNIVTSLGGHIDVASEPGAGTTFRIQLKTVDGGTGLARVHRPLLSSAFMRTADKPLRVLVVDDEPLIASTLGRALKIHDVTVALGGRKAARLLETDAAFDVIFCDILMPDLNGMELYRLIAASQPEVAARFVFMIGGTFTPQARDFLMSVENPTLTKPFKRKQLQRILNNHLSVQ